MLNGGLQGAVIQARRELLNEVEFQGESSKFIQYFQLMY